MIKFEFRCQRFRNCDAHYEFLNLPGNIILNSWPAGISFFLIPKIFSSGQADLPSIVKPLVHAQVSIERVYGCPIANGNLIMASFSIPCIRPCMVVIRIDLPCLDSRVINFSLEYDSNKIKCFINPIYLARWTQCGTVDNGVSIVRKIKIQGGLNLLHCCGTVDSGVRPKEF